MSWITPSNPNLQVRKEVVIIKTVLFLTPYGIFANALSYHQAFRNSDLILYFLADSARLGLFLTSSLLPESRPVAAGFIGLIGVFEDFHQRNRREDYSKEQ